MAQVQEVFLFNPTNIPDCQLWLDATDPNGTGVLPANGATLSTWKDKSSNAFVGTAINSPTVQQNSINGLATIQFNGTSQYIDFGNILNLGTSQIYIFSVVRFTGDGSIVQKSSYRGLITGRWLLIRYAAGGGVEMGIDNGTVTATAPFADSTTTPQMLEGYWDRSTVYTLQNGTQKASASLASSANLSSTDKLLVAAYGNDTGTGPQPGFYLNGVIGEILVYLTSMTTSQRQQIEGYLAWKWGLQGNLPANHPFKTYRPLGQTPFPTTIPPMPIVTQTVNVFAPTQISGCALWLDAADSNTVTLSGTSVTQWQDKSGSGNNANPYTSNPTLIQNVQNALPGLQFSGGQALSAGTIATGTAFSLFTVLRYTTVTGATDIISIGFWKKEYSSFLILSQANIAYGQISASGTYSQFGTGQSVPTNPTMITAIQSSDTVSANGYLLAGLNGAVVQYNSSSGPNTAADQSPFTIGGLIESGFSKYYMTGYIHEIVFYRAILSTQQRQQVEGYLAWKWGLTTSLPNGHPYKLPPIAPFPARSSAFNGGLTSWQPNQVSGLSLWIDAADRTTVTSNVNSIVTGVADKSGNGRNLTNTMTTNGFQWNQSSTLFNGKYPSFVYTGASQDITLGSNSIVSLSQPATVFTVHQILGSASFQDVFDSTTNGQRFFGFYFLPTPSTPNYRIFAGNTLVPAGNASMNPALYSYIFNSTASQIFENATSVVQGDAGTQSCAGITIGSRFTQNTETFQGHICEVLYYQGLLSTAQRQQIEGYLAWKWGLVGNLPSTHPYKLWPPSP